MTKRKNHAPDFKGRVALEAIREELTLSELAKKYGVHAGQISTWKRTALDKRTPEEAYFNGKKLKKAA